MKSFPTSLALVATLLGGCGDDGDDAARTRVAEDYADHLYASYAETVRQATALQTAVDAFAAAPSAASLDAARQAWKTAREPYLLTEVFRFYDGPIDAVEGQINAWPLDEVFIDYVEGAPDAGIINNTAAFPAITTEVITGQNEKGGEANISAGWHAIEFLLWGQDLSATGPGARPYTDYVPGGTATHPERRKTYLKLVTNLLVADLTEVRDAWAPDADNYRATFVTDKNAVRDILLGMGSLSGAELSGERMAVALQNRDQEDEHSCFSDNTHRDLVGNALGIQNVFLGTYAAGDGESISDLVRAKDPALADKLAAEMASSVAAIQDIPVPFDQAITNAAGQAKVRAAIEALQRQTATTVEAATALGITLNLK